MLNTADNEVLTRVGPGTEMGDLLRQYWLPALLSSELLAADGDPVRVLLLGEKLVAFRDTSGQVGLMPHNCPHRGASLFYGRNEEGGLRCVYHGWKFDVTGRCLDMPSEPAESTFKDRLRARAYPCVERGGIVWTYMGPRAVPPPLPAIEANQAPEDELQVTAVHRGCNWVQALEGDIDTSHFNFLHTGALDPEDATPGTFLRYSLEQRAPRYAVVDTPYGSMYGAYRKADPGRNYWRIGQFLFPFFTQIPTGLLGDKVLTRAWVPMDDENTMFFDMNTTRTWKTREKTQGATPTTSTVYTGQLPNTTDWLGRFRLISDPTNDHLIDRDWQRTGSYSGIDGIHAQDQAVTESMGEIFDRSTEHLGTSDIMVIRVRRRLLDAARTLREQGEVPQSVDDPNVYSTRSGGVLLDEGADWIAATEDLRQAYVEHPDLDIMLDRA